MNPIAEGPVLSGATSATVNEGSSVALGATDAAADSDDTLGNVRIAGLPNDLTNVNGGTYTPATGTTLVNFDSVNTSGGAVSGTAVTNYLASDGITFTSQSGTPFICPTSPAIRSQTRYLRPTISPLADRTAGSPIRSPSRRRSAP